MTIDAVSTTQALSSATSNAVSGGSTATADYDTFLTLLVAELKNQDPTEPMKSSEYVTQLATYSNVEQSIQTNQNLLTLLQSSYLEQASSLIGRTLTSPDGEISSVVTEVQLFSDGIVATLESGEEVVVSSGFRVS